MRVLLLGANGQIGRAITELSRTLSWPHDWQLIAWTREAGDLSQPIELTRHFVETKPDLIWNAAAYTQVDQAETERDLAQQINGKTVAEIAQYCARVNIPMIHYSTDYVYRGDGNKPHVEDEIPEPQNEYGKSKLIGDEAIQNSGCDYLIFRTSWVFSSHGKNFLKTMLKLSKERTELSIVSDQFGSPSYAPDLALNSLTAIQKSIALKKSRADFPSGIYHLCNSGVTSWYEFARAILPEFKIDPIASKDYRTPAKRPLNSRLSLKKIGDVFGIVPRSWDKALAECLKPRS